MTFFASGDKSSQTAGRTFSKQAISLSSTGAPASPSTQQIPLQTDKSQAKYSSRRSKLIIVSWICSILLSSISSFCICFRLQIYMKFFVYNHLLPIFVA